MAKQKLSSHVKNVQNALVDTIRYLLSDYKKQNKQNTSRSSVCISILILNYHFIRYYTVCVEFCTNCHSKVMQLNILLLLLLLLLFGRQIISRY